MYDIFLISDDQELLINLRKTFPFAKLANNIDDAKSQSLTKMCWIVYNTTDLSTITNITVPNWDCQYTHVFKTCQLIPKYINTTKTKYYSDVYVPQHDIFFISYNEVTADKNFNMLSKRFPRANRIHGITGIHHAHLEAAKRAESDYFWVVDADAVIVESFNFTIPDIINNAVYIWHSRNPINDLEYGYGGVKFLPKHLVLSMDCSSIDMTTSISKKICVVPEVSNVTAFNTDSFSTWKSAFRECVKLSSKTIKGQHDLETAHRLDVWCSTNNDRPYSRYAASGAIAGTQYGKQNADKLSALSKINDFDWLYNYFVTNVDAIGNISEMTLAHAIATS